MRNKRTLATMFAGLIVGVVAVFGLQAPAMAASGTIYTPSSVGSRGSGTYNVDTANNTLTLSVKANTLESGRCVTLYVDIARAPGVGKPGTHYDIRAARTCQSGSTRASGLQYEGSTYGIDITGINKLAICYGALNQLGTCNNVIGSVSSVDPNFDSNAKCSRSWTRNSSGTNFYFSGGNPWECSN